MIDFNLNDLKQTKLPKKAHSFYRERLAPNIVKSFDAILEASRDDQLEILEEIALLRECAGHTVELYSKAREVHFEKGTAATSQMVLHCALMMREALNEVIKAVEIAKKLDNASKNKLNITSFSFFIGRVMHIVNDALGNNLDAVGQINSGLEQLITDFDDELHNQTKSTPVDIINASVLRPDQTVLLMDATIPKTN
jgi:hypothetical protein